MKKLYTLLFSIMASVAFAQTFYSENFGTPTGTTTFANYTIGTAPATFQNAAPITYTGTGDVRTSFASTGYSGASGSGLVFLTSTAGRFLQISGLNTAAYASENLILSFGNRVESTTAGTLLVEQSTDGTNWTVVATTQNPTAGVWVLVTTASGQIPSSATLSLRFTQTGTAQIRIDDIKLSNVSASCLLALGTETTACDAVTVGIDTYTATIPFTGGGTATYGITTSSGTISGDNPSTSAVGNIIISGVSEGTILTVGVTGGTCNISKEIAAQYCKPINTLPYAENFDYPVGQSLGLQQKWNNYNSGDDITIAAGDLTYPGITSSGNSATFSGAGMDVLTTYNEVTTGTVYNSFLVNVTDYSNVTADGTQTYFAVLTNNDNDFKARVYIQKSGTQYLLGCTSATTPSPAIYSTTAYNVGDVVLVIVGYDFTANELKMWLNPAAATFTAATPATITETPVTAITELGGFLLRQDGAASTPTMTVDEVRVGTTTADLLSVSQNEITGLKLYPNPVSSGTLFIETNANAAKTVVIFDVVGKEVLNTKTTTNEVNVSNLKGGIYIVKITEQGKTATRKLVVR